MPNAAIRRCGAIWPEAAMPITAPGVRRLDPDAPADLVEGVEHGIALVLILRHSP